MTKQAPRNRSREAKARGKKVSAFEISADLDALIDTVAVELAKEMGTCTRTQALERMGREGAKAILPAPKKSPEKGRAGLDKD